MEIIGIAHPVWKSQLHRHQEVRSPRASHRRASVFLTAIIGTALKVSKSLHAYQHILALILQCHAQNVYQIRILSACPDVLSLNVRCLLTSRSQVFQSLLRRHPAIRLNQLVRHQKNAFPTEITGTAQKASRNRLPRRLAVPSQQSLHQANVLHMETIGIVQ